MSDYQHAIQALEESARTRIRLGLDRMRALLHALGDPHLDLRGALVAGTNGKGSVCATLDAISRADGRSTVLLVKPHLWSWTERIVINGKSVSEEQFADLAFVVLERAQSLGATDQPTTFELLTGMGFLAARRTGAETVICEVGLGGRLDSTNVVDLGVAVITNVGLDHTEYLGATVQEIAAEKAAIIKPGNIIVTAASEPALSVIRDAARAVSAGAEVEISGESSYETVHLGPSGVSIRLVSDPAHPLLVSSPLPGVFQAENLAIAASAARAMGIGDEIITRGASLVEWPARLQMRDGVCPTVVDCAHNRAGLESLFRSLPAILGTGPLVTVFGAMEDKLLPEMVDCVLAHSKSVIFTRASSPRAAAPAALPRAHEAHLTNDIRDAIEHARRTAEPGDVILICGSIALAGEALHELANRDDAERDFWTPFAGP